MKIILKILFVLELTKIVSHELVTPLGDGTSHNVDTFPVSKLIGEETDLWSIPFSSTLLSFELCQSQTSNDRVFSSNHMPSGQLKFDAFPIPSANPSDDPASVVTSPGSSENSKWRLAERNEVEEQWERQTLRSDLSNHVVTLIRNIQIPCLLINCNSSRAVELCMLTNSILIATHFTNKNTWRTWKVLEINPQQSDKYLLKWLDKLCSCHNHRHRIFVLCYSKLSHLDLLIFHWGMCSHHLCYRVNLYYFVQDWNTLQSGSFNSPFYIISEVYTSIMRVDLHKRWIDVV